MKKVLLGLLALSATLMATTTTPSPGVTGNAGENQIDVKTKAYIVNSGLIITGEATGITAIKSVELDHGTILAGTAADSTATRTVYIRRVAGANFPANTVLEVALKSPSGNNLINSTDDNKSMAHTLTAVVNSSSKNLSLSGDNSEAKDTFTIAATNHIPVALTSVIAQDQYATPVNSPEGEYNNTSTLSVKFSKNPDTVTEGVTR